MTGTEKIIGFAMSTQRPLNELYLNEGVAWVSEAAVLAGIPSGKRSDGLTVKIGLVEYWFLADLTTLEIKSSSVTGDAGDIAIVDAGTFFTGDNVEDALQEAGAAIAAIDVTLVALTAISVQSEYRIILPTASTVAGRCVTPTELPTGWTVAAGAVDTDLVITHNLHREICLISVMSTDSGTLEKSNLPIGSNYNNFKDDQYGNIITIQSLATVEKEITIHLIFGSTLITQP